MTSRHRLRLRRAAALVMVALPVVAGCTAQATEHQQVRVLRTEVPVSEPVYSHDLDALFALTDSEHSLAKIEPAPGSTRTAISPRLDDIGENIATSPTDHDRIFVPQPELDRIAVLDARSLRQVGALPVGHAPSYVSVDVGSKVLLAISETGHTVTSVDLREGTVLPPQPVEAGPEAEVEGAKRGRLVDYHVTRPTRVTHYKGPRGGVHKKDQIGVSADKTAGDKIKASRLYAAEKGSDELVAVDTHRRHEGMHVVARSSVGAPIKHLATDEVRIYAATERELIVLESNSYEGFSDNSFTVVERIDYRKALPSEKLKGAALSGMAVGTERVFLSLDGEPYIVSVDKPAI